jgi:hypothetical protein
VFAIVMTFPIPINLKTLLNCFEKLKKTAQRIAKTLKNVPKTF